MLINIEKNDKIEKNAKEKITNFIESNIAAIFMSMNKVSIARKLSIKTNEYFRKACH